MSVAPDAPPPRRKESMVGGGFRQLQSMAAMAITGPNMAPRSRVTMKNFRLFIGILLFYGLMPWRKGYPCSQVMYRVNMGLCVVIFTCNFVLLNIRRGDLYKGGTFDFLFYPSYLVSYAYCAFSWLFGVYFFNTTHENIEKLLKLATANQESEQRVLITGRRFGFSLLPLSLLLGLTWVSVNIAALVLLPDATVLDYVWYATRIVDIIAIITPFLLSSYLAFISELSRVTFVRIRQEKTYNYPDHTAAKQVDTVLFTALRTFAMVTVIISCTKVGFAVQSLVRQKPNVSYPMADVAFRILDGLFCAVLQLVVVVVFMVRRRFARRHAEDRIDALPEGPRSAAVSFSSMGARRVASSYAAQYGQNAVNADSRLSIFSAPGVKRVNDTPDASMTSTPSDNEMNAAGVGSGRATRVNSLEWSGDGTPSASGPET